MEKEPSIVFKVFALSKRIGLFLLSFPLSYMFFMFSGITISSFKLGGTWLPLFLMILMFLLVLVFLLYLIWKRARAYFFWVLAGVIVFTLIMSIFLIMGGILANNGLITCHNDICG